MKSVLIRVLCCLAGLASPLALAQGAGAGEGLVETIHTVKLARGSTLTVLVNKRIDASPTIAVLLFAGYPGILKIRSEEGKVSYELGGNFLVRARRFLNNDSLFTVMVDCPADQWARCDDRYRASDEHAGDVAEVIASLRKDFGAQKFYLLGTSYGTVSSSHLAKALAGSIDGAVHSATFTDPRPNPGAHGSMMRGFDWSQAATPQLFVHHKNDPCDVTRYASVMSRKKDLPLITVEGSANARGEPCKAFSEHGFVGREKVVMSAIAEWISTRKVAALVGSEN